MRISSIEEYGLRCLITLASQGKDEQLTIPEIAQKEGLSEPYVGKILSLLKKGKLIKSVRGRNGGFSLSRTPEKISLLEAVTTLGGPLIEHDHCNKYTGLLEKCVHFDCCSVRYVLGGLIEYIGEFLSKTTLADVMKNHELSNKEWLAGISKSYSASLDASSAGVTKQSEFEI